MDAGGNRLRMPAVCDDMNEIKSTERNEVKEGSQSC